MTQVVWPFPQRSEMIEVLMWVTDVMRAKAGEQRVALRTAPRRTFQLSHTLDDYSYSHARALMRGAQGSDGFLVPDWGQSTYVGSVSAGSAVPVSQDLSYVDMGDMGLLWESSSKFEVVTLTTDSGGTVLDTVTGAYTQARLLPLWAAHAPEGLSATRIGARLNQFSVAMQVAENRDLAETPAGATYRSLDVLDECPVIGSGELSEGLLWPVTDFDNPVGLAHYIRQRSIPDFTSTMRWHVFTAEGKYALRTWLHYRRGRQKAFWLSSRGKDLEPAASPSGTTVRVYGYTGLAGLGRDDVFDIEVKTAAGSYYRRVTALAAGPTTNGRPTINMTVDSSLSVSMTDIERISYLRCMRLDADRVELLHSAAGGMSAQVPMIEIPTP